MPAASTGTAYTQGMNPDDPDHGDAQHAVPPVSDEPLSGSVHHLSRIETLWSVVRDGAPDRPNAAAAQRQLLARYGGSVRRYLQASLRDSDAVDEVYQEFALRLVRGDFRNADQTRGRFRNYVKSVVYRLMVDHHRAAAKRRLQVPLQHDPQAGGTNEQERDCDAAFTTSWRDELLAQAWAALQQVERDGGPPYYAAMQLRVAHPQWSSTELAVQLGRRLGRDLQSGAVRVMIHRARERFSDAVISAVVDSLQEASFEAIEEELLELNLMSYCRSALQRYRGTPPAP